MTKYIICGGCKNKIEVTEDELERFEELECPHCEGITTVGKVYDTRLNEDSEEFDLDQELKFK